MGGQACVFYGAAQFSKDVDLALLASEENYSRLLAALGDLNARRIAVPRFDPALLARGHAVHFRCQGGDADGLFHAGRVKDWVAGIVHRAGREDG